MPSSIWKIKSVYGYVIGPRSSGRCIFVTGIRILRPGVGRVGIAWITSARTDIGAVGTTHKGFDIACVIEEAPLLLMSGSVPGLKQNISPIITGFYGEIAACFSRV